MVDIGQKVYITCVCTLDSGARVRLYDGEGDQFTFILGDDKVLHGISKAVSEMSAGERRSIRLEPGEAFGTYDAAQVERIPSRDFPHWEKLPVGHYIEVRDSFGNIRVKVLSANEDEVVLDHNHELADQALNIELELLRVHGEGGSPLEMELEHGEGCSCGCHRLKQQLQPDGHHHHEHEGACC